MSQKIISGKLVIDGTGRPPIEGGAVLVEGERIVAVGKQAEINVAPDTEVIDCTNQVLIPGLIDCHNHLSLDTTLDNYPCRMDDSVPELTLRAVETLRVDLAAGVTTSRCLCDKSFLDIVCKKAVESGRLKGPRLLVATRGIRASHGHGFVGYPFDGLEQVRSAVRENLKAGADLIKIYLTGTLKGSGEMPCYLSRSEIFLAVQEALRIGVKTAAHCIGGIGIEWCLEAGLCSIEHGYFMTDQQIDRLAQSESWLVMTPSPFFAAERIRTLPSDLSDRFHRERDMAAERMAAAIKGGVKFAVGTDGMHGGLAQEVAYLVELGASVSDAFMAATVNGAQVCGLGERIGTLESGKMADIIGVNGNPLQDIQALGRVETVILKGNIEHIAETKKPAK